MTVVFACHQSPVVVIRRPTSAFAATARHRYRADTPRSALALAAVLSLLLHALVFIALFDSDPSAPETAHSNVVSVRLLASPPAALSPPSAQLPPSHATSSAESPAKIETEEIRKQGDAPPAKSASAAATPTRVAPALKAFSAQARITSHPTAPLPSAPPRPTPMADNPAYESPSDYLRLLALRLAAVKQYPVAALAQHQEGVVLLAFRLDRGGRVISWQIARSSGHDELDDEVSRMVAQAAPFPPFPATWHDASASFTVPIGFSLY